MKGHFKKAFKATTILSALIASSPLMAIEQGDILINARILHISPNVGSNQVTVGGDPTVLSSGIDIDSAYSLGADITYMVNNNFGVELMLDTASKHDIRGTGNLAGKSVGDVIVLPPSVIALWHFMPKNNIRPYVGAGINYTMFFSEGTTNEFTSAMGATSTGLSVDDTFGLVAQAGVDVDIDKDWYVSFDVKYVDINTTATVSVNGVDTAKVDFDINPLVLGVGVGTRF